MDNTKLSKVAKIFAVTGNTTVSKSSNKAATQTAATSNAQLVKKAGAKIIQKVAIADINIEQSPKTRLFYNISKVRQYAKLMGGGAIFPPPVLVINEAGTMLVGDGLYRIEAQSLLGRKRIDVVIEDGNDMDALQISLRANNKHGVAYTREEIRMNVKRLLKNKRWQSWSSRKIAELCGTTHNTVESVRKLLLLNKKSKKNSQLRSFNRNGKQHQMNVGAINSKRAKIKAQGTPPDKNAILKIATEINQSRSQPVKFGDRFLIKSKNGWGYHIIICGDSTCPECVNELFGEKKADLYLTDPPYNAAINSNRTSPSPENEEFIANNKMGDKEFKKFIWKVFSLSRRYLNDGAPYYIWTAFPYLVLKMMLIHRILGAPHQPIVWNKKRFVYHARYDYSWGHELCIYGWIRGQKRIWLGDPSQTTMFDGFTYEDTAYDIKAKHHPCPKPVAITQAFIENSLAPGKIVYDSFLGSGTTLIAAELAGRLCYGVEFVPEYLAVLLDAAESEPLGLETIPVPPGISIHAFIKSLPTEEVLGLLP